MTAGEISLLEGELWCEEWGPRDGPPIVLLHGLGSSAADWAPQIPAFAERHRVIALDLPGHGHSALGRPRRVLARPRPTVEGMACAVARALVRMEDRPTHIVGLSLGGCVALALALDVPDRVRSLVLVNAFARLRPAGWRGAWRMLERLALLAAAPMPVVAARVAQGLFPDPDQAELRAAAVASLSRTDKRAYLAGMRAVARFDVRRRLTEIACPTLVMAGDRDATVPRASAELLGRRMPAARLVVVPGSGHATPCDRPDLFNRLVLEFVAGH